MKSLVSTAVVAIVASTLSAAEPLYVPAAQGDLPAATQPEVLVIPAPEPEPSRVAPAVAAGRQLPPARRPMPVRAGPFPLSRHLRDPAA